MIQISANVNRSSIDKTIKALSQFNEARGLTVRFICWDVMRSILLDCIRRTAPWAGKSTLGTFAAQKKCGQSAVRNDLDRAFADADRVVSFDRDGKKFVRVSDTNQVYKIDAANWKPSIPSRHLELRNKRGRVPKQKRQSWVSFKDLKKYEKTVASRVGSLKAGWIPALYHYARLSKGSIGRIPQWITNQAVKAGVFGGVMSGRGAGEIYSANSAHHWRGIREDSIRWIIAFNDKNLRNWSAFRIRRLCDQFNGGERPIPRLRSAA